MRIRKIIIVASLYFGISNLQAQTAMPPQVEMQQEQEVMRVIP